MWKCANNKVNYVVIIHKQGGNITDLLSKVTGRLFAFKQQVGNVLQTCSSCHRAAHGEILPTQTSIYIDQQIIDHNVIQTVTLIKPVRNKIAKEFFLFSFASLLARHGQPTFYQYPRLLAVYLMHSVSHAQWVFTYSPLMYLVIQDPTQQLVVMVVLSFQWLCFVRCLLSVSTPQDNMTPKPDFKLAIMLHRQPAGPSGADLCSHYISLTTTNNNYRTVKHWLHNYYRPCLPLSYSCYQQPCYCGFATDKMQNVAHGNVQRIGVSVQSESRKRCSIMQYCAHSHLKDVQCVRISTGVALLTGRFLNVFWDEYNWNC